MSAPIRRSEGSGDFANHHKVEPSGDSISPSVPNQKLFDLKRSVEFNANPSYQDPSTKKVEKFIHRFL